MKLLYCIAVLSIGCFQPESKLSDNTVKDSIENIASDTFKEKVVTKETVQAKPVVISKRDQILRQSVSISNEFYNCLLKQNYACANANLHPDALAETTLTEWIEVYKKAQTKMGRLGYVKMVDHGAKSDIKGGNGKGDYAELIFDTQYKDGNMREKLIFFRKDSTESVKLLGYEYHAIIDDITLSDILR